MIELLRHQFKLFSVINILLCHIAGNDGEDVERKVRELVNFTHFVEVIFLLFHPWIHVYPFIDVATNVSV